MAQNGRTDRSRRRNHSEMPLSIGIAMQLSRISWLQGHLSTVRYGPNRTALLGRSTRLLLTRLFCSVPVCCLLCCCSCRAWHRYASLFFIVGTRNLDGQENTENELGMLEFIHNLVECMDKWAGSICELDVRTILTIRTITHSMDRFCNAFSPTGDRPTNRSCTRYVTLFRSITVLCLFPIDHYI
jgi:hypothetical protein